jgi:peptidoglycan/LPS O-acetylase OafA/YrhL
VAAHLLGVQALGPVLWPWLRRAAPAVAWLAGASFTLYLLHYPLIHFIAAAMPGPETYWASRLLVFVLPPLAALALAEATERRRHAWRRAIAALLGGRRTA